MSTMSTVDTVDTSTDVVDSVARRATMRTRMRTSVPRCRCGWCLPPLPSAVVLLCWWWSWPSPSGRRSRARTPAPTPSRRSCFEHRTTVLFYFFEYTLARFDFQPLSLEAALIVLFSTTLTTLKTRHFLYTLVQSDPPKRFATRNLLKRVYIAHRTSHVGRF